MVTQGGHQGDTTMAALGPAQPLSPPMGGPPNKPPTCLHETCMLPRQKATKQATPDSWDLVPSRWDKMFSAKLFSEKFQKVSEHFRFFSLKIPRSSQTNSGTL